MFKRILLPTDGSALSRAAVHRGVEFAKRIQAAVLGIVVIPERKYYLYQTGIIVQSKEETIRQHRPEADRILAVVTQAAQDAGVPCETLCEASDHPHEAIIEVCEKRGCDLIMMASHGRKGVASLLLGSETQKVLTHSRIPVMVLR